jgi:hypothetical protein
VLRIWDDGGDFISFWCARCETPGWAKQDGETAPRREVGREPSPPEPDKADLARYLWSSSLPLRGSLAETYLRSRQCFIPSENLRFLPGRGDHPPSMIARFGSGEVTGVHLTKLRADGLGKAGTEKDKIMIGPSVGQPIMLHENLEHSELVTAEGIEDAASLALVTGWSAWAAGSAGRIASMVEAATAFDRVFCSVDLDWGKKERVRAGPNAIRKTQAIRADVIPLHFEKTLGFKSGLDANKALIRFGADPVMAVIEWCDAQARMSRGEIGFNQMQAACSRALGIFAALAEDPMAIEESAA